ncbi:hypothetical protein THAOC_31336 [Thalassiosira oceanica]|uniref:Uncharacterized protein n=1 Tax=Thalassiosira oceanica TaxID=159749 RepID=K0R8E8_THAOC|nr:hypothetical protein THAOC_31336 [Thalassiosira oceanica]|eukprot:EJK49753.1 hypothetical protein THAOC_31336 [Thalassiosira oceanica]
MVVVGDVRLVSICVCLPDRFPGYRRCDASPNGKVCNNQRRIEECANGQRTLATARMLARGVWSNWSKIDRETEMLARGSGKV